MIVRIVESIEFILHKLNFSFVLMVLLCLLVWLTLNWRVGSASVSSHTYVSIENNSSQNVSLVMVSMHVHLQFIDFIDSGVAWSCTAESAQSTPTHPWPTELRTPMCTQTVSARGEVCSLV